MARKIGPKGLDKHIGEPVIVKRQVSVLCKREYTGILTKSGYDYSVYPRGATHAATILKRGDTLFLKTDGDFKPYISCVPYRGFISV